MVTSRYTPSLNIPSSSMKYYFIYLYDIMSLLGTLLYFSILHFIHSWNVYKVFIKKTVSIKTIKILKDANTLIQNQNVGFYFGNSLINDNLLMSAYWVYWFLVFVIQSLSQGILQKHVCIMTCALLCSSLLTQHLFPAAKNTQRTIRRFSLCCVLDGIHLHFWIPISTLIMVQ